MSLTDAADNRKKAEASLAEQNRLIVDQQNKVRALKRDIDTLNEAKINPAYKGTLNEADITNGIATATAKLAVERARLNQLQGKAQSIQEALESLEYRRVSLIRQQAAEQNAITQSLRRMNGQHSEFNRLLSLGNDLLSARQVNALFPFRTPDATLTDKKRMHWRKAARIWRFQNLKARQKSLSDSVFQLMSCD